MVGGEAWRGPPLSRGLRGGDSPHPPAPSPTRGEGEWSLQEGFDLILLPRREFVAHDGACAGVPAQERIVVSRRADGFGFLEKIHCIAQPIVRLRSAARRTPFENRLRLTFKDNPSVIRAFILIVQARQQLAGIPDFIASAPTELVGYGQD